MKVMTEAKTSEMLSMREDKIESEPVYIVAMIFKILKNTARETLKALAIFFNLLFSFGQSKYILITFQ